MKNEARLTLVGAGPGDPDLITVKGIKALAEADVVLYDALISKELLKYAPNSLKVFVGKRKGDHRYSQDEINALIVENAFNYGHVVRLKGGDPFIFGRGSEEINYVDNFGIPCTIVPGISSSLAVPANVGIPLTKRKVSESFWVITGCTSNNKLSNDIKIASQTSATLVILMGMHKIKEITSVLQKNNKGDTPIAIIQNGTTQNERIGVGTVNNILEIVSSKKLSSPAIIIIGEVVKESIKLREIQKKLYLNNLSIV